MKAELAGLHSVFPHDYPFGQLQQLANPPAAGAASTTAEGSAALSAIVDMCVLYASKFALLESLLHEVGPDHHTCCVACADAPLCF